MRDRHWKELLEVAEQSDKENRRPSRVSWELSEASRFYSLYVSEQDLCWLPMMILPPRLHEGVGV